MIANRTPLLLLSAAVLIPATLNAQDPGFRDFGVQCTSAQFRACASVQAWNERDAETGEFFLFVRLANMQGRAGYEDTQVAGLSHWTVRNLALDGFGETFTLGGNLYNRSDFGFGSDITSAESVEEFLWSFSPYGIGDEGSLYCGAADDCASRTDRPSLGKEFNVTGGPLYNLTSGLIADNERMLWGCDVAPLYFEIEAGAWSSCHGSFTYRLNLGGEASFALTDATSIRLDFASVDAAGNFIADACGTDPQNGEATCSTDVAPEPITMVLLGSGLLGIGGLRAMRRRRKEEFGDVDD